VSGNKVGICRVDPQSNIQSFHARLLREAPEAQPGSAIGKAIRLSRDSVMIEQKGVPRRAQGFAHADFREVSPTAQSQVQKLMQA